MKKLFSSLFLLGLLIPFCEVTKANEYQFFKTTSSIIDSTPTIKFYGLSSSGNETLLNTWESTTTDVEIFGADLEDARVDHYTGKIYFKVTEDLTDPTVITTILEYDLSNNTVQKLKGISDIEQIIIYPKVINNMISKNDSTGVLSLGENSLKLKETSNSQKMWATDSQGRIAPINITNGSKLLINGRDVEQSINNVGALSAALTGLPTVPTNTTLACGLGTGTHGGDFAFSGGCASKVNERLSINYAASITVPGQDYAGDFKDKYSARAGFVWKLGKAIEPNQISMTEKEIIVLKEGIIALQENNQNIISENKSLLARLEKLEKITLIENK
mgnify:CR=1 FL=1|tara:strand:- start:494 stop:1489 length:996 start_codon:yes stop_codon:yes gene_type:complete